jgi:DNA-binding NarL/FixJ family response regulator
MAATTVLVVDDHESFRRVARMLLEFEGYVVVGEAADGETGIRAARELAPDWVLLDVQLPDIDGFDVAARLSSDERAPAVILTSSQDHMDFSMMIRRSGARGFIPKAEITGERLAALLP